MFCLRNAALVIVFLCAPPTPVAAQILHSDLDGIEIEKEYLWRLGDDSSLAPESRASQNWRKQSIESFPSSWTGIGWLLFQVRVQATLEEQPIGLRMVQDRDAGG